MSSQWKVFLMPYCRGSTRSCSGDPWRLLREIARHSMSGGRCDFLEVVSVILCHTSDHFLFVSWNALDVFSERGGRWGGGGFGCDLSARKLVFGVFFFLGSYQLKANYRKRIMLTCSYYLRFICVCLDFCAIGLHWAETSANGSPSIELRFACFSDWGQPRALRFL